MQIIRAYSERGQTHMNITHTILATVGSIIVMFAISKLLGNKQISQLTLFDYINGITIGSIASEMAVSQEMDELIVPVIAMVLYGLTGFLLSVLTMKSIHCRHFLSGKPILLIEKGKIYPENLRLFRHLKDILRYSGNQRHYLFHGTCHRSTSHSKRLRI